MHVNIYNDLGSTDVYLFFDYHAATAEVNMPNKAYLQPWKDGSLPLDQPYPLSFQYLNSGTFWFLVANEEGAKTIAAMPTISMGTEDRNWVGGFCELSYIEGAGSMPYFDVTNVDSMGLVCGVKFSAEGETTGDQGTCGYGAAANDLIAGLMTACGLKSDTSAKISITGTDGNTYNKLIGPTQPQHSPQYNGIYREYIDAITANATGITIASDQVSSDSLHGGTPVGSGQFVGVMGPPASLVDDGSSLKASDVVCYFEAKDYPATGTNTYIYLTADALNPLSIVSGNSAGGMYVYPAFEYADPSNQSTIKKGGWAENVSLNWTATGEHAVADTTCFQAGISSVGRDLVTAMNLGYIGVSAEHNTFVYRDPSTHAPDASQQKYVNQWNNYITSLSDSYGMAYTDGTHVKVLFNPPATGTIDIRILKQDDPHTKDYWSKSSS